MAGFRHEPVQSLRPTTSAKRLKVAAAPATPCSRPKAALAAPSSTCRVSASASSSRMNPEAGDGARTHDPQLGKLMLYQLSYAREAFTVAVCGLVVEGGATHVLPPSLPLGSAKRPAEVLAPLRSQQLIENGRTVRGADLSRCPRHDSFRAVDETPPRAEWRRAFSLAVCATILAVLACVVIVALVIWAIWPDLDGLG